MVSARKELQRVPGHASASGVERPRSGAAGPDFPGSAAIGIICRLATNQEVAGSSPAGRAKVQFPQSLARIRLLGLPSRDGDCDVTTGKPALDSCESATNRSKIRVGSLQRPDTNLRGCSSITRYALAPGSTAWMRSAGAISPKRTGCFIWASDRHPAVCSRQIPTIWGASRDFDFRMIPPLTRGSLPRNCEPYAGAYAVTDRTGRVRRRLGGRRRQRPRCSWERRSSLRVLGRARRRSGFFQGEWHLWNL